MPIQGQVKHNVPWLVDALGRIVGYRGERDQEFLVVGAEARVPSLSLDLASTNSFIDQLPDGTWIGTSNDTDGFFGGQLWTATGTLDSPTRTGRTVTRVANLFDAAGNSLSSGTIRCAWALPDGNMLFDATAGSGRSYLFYGRNTAGTWSVGNNATTYNNGRPVLEIGNRLGVHPVGIRSLHNRSLCIADIGGSTVLLFGEYNVASGRVPGSTNDQVRVWRSNDLGITWSILCEWNTNGSSSQVRHVHGIVQDPITKLIYILIGDDPTSGIIRWNGVAAAPAANTSIAAYANVPGWSSLFIAGLRNDFYRTGDLIFSGDYAAYLVDRADNLTLFPPRVISRAGPLVDHPQEPVTAGAGRDALIGVAVPGGGGLWFSLYDTTTGGTRGFTVWSSADCRKWYEIGQLQDVGTTGTTSVIANVFWARNQSQLIVTLASGASRFVAGSYGGSLVFNVRTPWDGAVRNLS